MSEKIISMSEVKKHKKRKSAWIVIHNEVYDVSKFLHEHPGGEEVLMEYAGKDGTQAFEDVGHSDDARTVLSHLKIGALPPQERKIHTKNCATSKSSRRSMNMPIVEPPELPTFPAAGRRVTQIVVPRQSNKWKYILLALALAGVAAFAYKKMKG